MSYGQSGDPYQQSPYAEAGYGQGQYGHNGQYNGQYNNQQQQHQPQASNSYEMQDFNAPPQPQGPPPLNQSAFLNQVTSISNSLSSYTQTTTHIATLHAQLLSSTDVSAGSAQHQQLEAQVAHAGVASREIREAIRSLQRDAARTPSGTALKELKNRQVERLKEEFRARLQEYRGQESDFQRRYREGIKRQFRVVNPHASEAEVEQAMDTTWGGESVFATAIMNSRSTQARATLSAVQARHADLQRIEQTMVELASIMEDLNTVIVEQEYPLANIERKAEETEQHLSSTLPELDKTKGIMVKLRKHKWICFWISVAIVIVIIVLIIIGVGVASQWNFG